MKTVLFVVESEAVLKCVRSLADEKNGRWNVLFTKTTEHAVAFLANVTVDAVVAELGLVMRAETSLLKHAKRSVTLRRTPCLMLAGAEGLRVKKKALRDGATDFYDMPIDSWGLGVRIDTLIRLKQYQDEALEQEAILQFRIQETTKELEYSRRLVLLRLALAAEWRDQDTGAHLVRVGLLSRLIADELGFDQESQSRILLTSPLHDVGKIGLSDRILLGTGPLTDEDRLAMQKHCETGHQILAGDVGLLEPLLATHTYAETHSDLLDQAALIALCHHEHWDGTGYPRGLAGEKIPIEARIVAVADVYDALRSRRTYKKPIGMLRAANIIANGAGTHFDPQVANALLARLEEAEGILARHSDNLPNLLAA